MGMRTMRSKHFFTGFGSTLSLYPPEPNSLSKLRKRRFPLRYRLTPLSNAEARKANAKTILNVVERMVRSSAELDRSIQAFVKSTKSGDGHNHGEGYEGMDSQRKLKVRPYRTGNLFKSSKVFSVHADRARGLADLLAIHEDSKKVCGDLVSADKDVRC